MKYYKLTSKNNQTEGRTQWGEGVTHKAEGKGKELCSADVIHVYDHSLKAVMFNPIHANFPEYNLWECRVTGVVANDGLKVGVKECTTVTMSKPPVVNLNQRICFAIFCALKVYHKSSFVSWANDWLSGKDRTEAAARAATTKKKIDFVKLIKKAMRKERIK